jgi:uracil-DNA glycosylase
MGIADLILDHPEAALAALAWQLELGADEAVQDQPVNRYEDVAKPVAAPRPVAAPVVAPAAVMGDAVQAAEAAAAGAGDLAALRAALAGFDGCELKRGARSTVFADGNPAAQVMILGEAPGREEDQEGLPFVGRAGQLLDRMFTAIGLSRGSAEPDSALYITNVLPWRPPQNREPTAEEIAMLRPFVLRHIALADPKVIVVMGNTPCQALLGTKGITRLRGTWTTALGRPVLPMTHPAYLLRTPLAKREAWADLQALQQHLRGMA